MATVLIDLLIWSILSSSRYATPSSFALALRLQFQCNPLYSYFDVDLSVGRWEAAGSRALADQEKVSSPTCAPATVPFEAQKYTFYVVTCGVLRDEDRSLNLELVCIHAAAHGCRSFSVSRSCPCGIVMFLFSGVTSARGCAGVACC